MGWKRLRIIQLCLIAEIRSFLFSLLSGHYHKHFWELNLPYQPWQFPGGASDGGSASGNLQTDGSCIADWLPQTTARTPVSPYGTFVHIRKKGKGYSLARRQGQQQIFKRHLLLLVDIIYPGLNIVPSKFMFNRNLFRNRVFVDVVS